MDLKLEDVAKLLRVPQLKVKQWLDEGRIPSYKLGSEIRFDRMELESWLLQNSPSMHFFENAFDPAKEIDISTESTLTTLDGSQSDELGMLKYDLYRAIYRGDIYKELEGRSKEVLLQEATQRLALKCPVDPDALYKMLLARERLMPTGLGQGIAVPHTRDFLLDTHFDVICVVYPKEPLEYGSIDHQKVHTLFFLFACSDRTHLHLLAKIASFCQSPANLRFLQSKPEKPKLLEAILRFEKQI